MVLEKNIHVERSLFGGSLQDHQFSIAYILVGEVSEDHHKHRNCSLQLARCLFLSASVSFHRVRAQLTVHSSRSAVTFSAMLD